MHVTSCVAALTTGLFREQLVALVHTSGVRTLICDELVQGWEYVGPSGADSSGASRNRVQETWLTVAAGGAGLGFREMW